jgi:hypothetical protein
MVSSLVLSNAIKEAIMSFSEMVVLPTVLSRLAGFVVDFLPIAVLSAEMESLQEMRLVTLVIPPDSDVMPFAKLFLVGTAVEIPLLAGHSVETDSLTEMKLAM